MFEFRLEGGKVFHIGYLPPGLRGGLSATKLPGFCRPPQFPDSICEGATGAWSIEALDQRARDIVMADARKGCRPIVLTDATPGVGLVSLHSGRQPFILDIRLSAREISADGPSVYEDWLGIVRAAKDDLNVEALLRLDFGEATAQEIDRFEAGGIFATTNIELTVRPRLVQWSRDD